MVIVMIMLLVGFISPVHKHLQSPAPQRETVYSDAHASEVQPTGPW